MSTHFFHSSHMPCPECGASVEARAAGSHECDPERVLDYRMFQLRDGLACFEQALTEYLRSPEGRFAQWAAERKRPPGL
jgi:hypothetical protein